MDLFNHVNDFYLDSILNSRSATFAMKDLVLQEKNNRRVARRFIEGKGFELPTDGLSNVIKADNVYITRDYKGFARVVFITDKKVINCVVADYTHPDFNSLAIIESDGRFFLNTDSCFDLVSSLRKIESLVIVDNQSE